VLGGVSLRCAASWGSAVRTANQARQRDRGGRQDREAQVQQVVVVRRGRFLLMGHDVARVRGFRRGDVVHPDDSEDERAQQHPLGEPAPRHVTHPTGVSLDTDTP
jgi:hypothetical protein